MSLLWVRRILLVAAAGVVAGRLGLMAPQYSAPVPLLWPFAGVALAAMLCWGLPMWPAVWVAAFFQALTSGMSPWPAVAVAAASTCGPALASWLLSRQGLRNALDRQRDLFLFIAVGAVFGTLVSAVLGVAGLAAAGAIEAKDLVLAGGGWWLAGACGTVLVGVPLMTLSRPASQHAFGAWRWVPNALLFACAIGSAALVFATRADAIGTYLPFVFLPHLLLAWLAVRGGLFVASLAALVAGTGATLATLLGHGPFFHTADTIGLLLLCGYVLTLSAAPLVVAALVGELAARDARWQLALDSSSIGVAQWDDRGGRVELSRRWLLMLGYSTQNFGLSARDCWNRVHESDRPLLKRALDSLTDIPTDNCRGEFRMQCANARWKWFEGHALVTERSSAGAPSRVLLTARDITEQHAAQERQLLATQLFQHLHEGLLITDAAHHVLDANPTYASITGYARDEMLGRVPALLRPAVEGSAAAQQQAVMRDSIQATGTWRGEITTTRRNGESCTLQVTMSAVRGPTGELRFHAVALSDVTETQRQRELLEHRALFDELTGLPNRRQLGRMLREAMSTSERDGFLLTVCYLDLDHFKPINDRHGHAAGDRLLAELADRLRRSMRSRASGNDTVARVGGDEFVLLLRSATLEESHHAVERVLRNVSQPYALGVEGGPMVMTASIGATVYPIDKAGADTLLRHADHAMYGAKQAGRSGYQFFDAEHNRRAEAHFEALGRVEEALDAGQFILYYQPKVNMRLGTVLGFEALLRWKHPVHGLIPPSQFLPLIEHTGLSARVGDWVMQQGIEQLARWLQLGLDITVSINLSARHLQDPRFAQRLAALLGRHETPVARHLILEVLETAALADMDHTCALMEECRTFGVRFALDDFGTGYSTFTYLKRFPLDVLKIDRSFVHNMLDDHQDLAIVEGVIGLSRTFQCAIVAEGVETPEQGQRLVEMGCDIGQGNGIAKAMPADEVLAWVQGYRGYLSAEARTGAA